MNNPKVRQALLFAGFVLLAVVAAAGWMRNPERRYDTRAVYGQSMYGQAAYAPEAAYGQQAVPANCAEPLAVQSAAYAPEGMYGDPAAQYRTYSRPRVVRTIEREPVVTERIVERQPAYRERERVVERPVARNKRSTAKSVAIVGGSAGAGAAIGALAGGGKGAAIGALSGGAAGFIYDRLTHNR